MLRLLAAPFLALILAGCAPTTSGVFTSPEAVDVGGSLFVEPINDEEFLLVLDGEITPQTSYTFQSMVEQNEIVSLVITQSPGGDLAASHQIGRAIKREGITTTVLASCISACVDVFIAGVERGMASDAVLGLHGAEDREFGLSLDRPYWRDMGFAAINERAYEVPFDQLLILDATEARRLRLATEVF